MANEPTQRPEVVKATPPAPANTSVNGSGEPAAPASSAPTAPQSGATSPARPPSRGARPYIIAVASIAALAAIVYFAWPEIDLAFSTVSTDDAYVNGHVTFVAARVPGQVARVLVDDNYRVKKGDVLVELDPEPYRVQVEIRQAALDSAKAGLVEANAQVRALVGQTRANRYALDYAIEKVNDQVAQLRASVATYNSHKAELELARSNLRRAEELAPSGGISKEELDVRRQTVKVDEATTEEALQTIYANRASLGLPPQPPQGEELSDVPAGIDQNFSTVREALAALMESAAQLGYYPSSYNLTPKEAIDDFYKQDPHGDLDHIYADIIANAPTIKQAQAKVEQAQADLDEANLNLNYCKVVSAIDGVVTRRSVNPGNNVQAGQSLMAVRSLTEIWIDANFKETQLDYLRIGQRVECDVDMYGSVHQFEGRITGFTMGTGETLSLLPPQNATGNFVKIVQRLPVRIELTDYDPDKLPLFVGLSVEPHVFYKEPPTGPNAGKFLQPDFPLPQAPVDPND